MFHKLIPPSLTRSASIGAISGATMLALAGCASSRSSTPGISDSADSREVRISDNTSAPVDDSATETESAVTSTQQPSDPGVLSEDQFTQLLRGLPPENVSVVIHERAAIDANNDQRRDIALTAVVNDPVVGEFATLGAYLNDLGTRAPANERISIRAMSDFALRVAGRVSLEEASLNPEVASELKLSAARELSEWFRRDERLGNSSRDVYSVTGRDRLAVLADGHESNSVGDGSSAIRESVGQLILLREAVSIYGTKLWGEEIASNRFRSTSLLIKMLDSDLQAAERGQTPRGAIVDADQQLGEAASRLSQIIVLGADPIIAQLREVSPESGAAIVGSGAFDTTGFVTFLAFSREEQSVGALKRWLLVRELPLDRLCVGAEQLSIESPTPDQVTFFDQALTRIGPFK